MAPDGLDKAEPDPPKEPRLGAKRGAASSSKAQSASSKKPKGDAADSKAKESAALRRLDRLNGAVYRNVVSVGLPYPWTPDGAVQLPLDTASWDLRIRVVDFLDAGTSRGEWNSELLRWAARLGFATEFTNDPTRRQVGSECGIIAGWVAVELHAAGAAGAGDFMTVDLSGALSREVRVLGYAHVDALSGRAETRQTRFISESEVTRAYEHFSRHCGALRFGARTDSGQKDRGSHFAFGYGVASSSDSNIYVAFLALGRAPTSRSNRL